MNIVLTGTMRCLLLLILLVFIDVSNRATATGISNDKVKPRSLDGVQSGQLTAADIDDNLNFLHYLSYKDRTLEEPNGNGQYLLPSPVLTDRITVRVSDENGDPFSCAMVQVGSGDGGEKIELPAATNGRLSVFPTLDGLPSGGPATWEIVARAPEGSCPDDCSGKAVLQMNGNESTVATETNSTMTVSAGVEVTIPKQSTPPNKLDLALIVDTTGSMCDELIYLQTEIGDVIQTILNNVIDDGPVDVRLAIVVYKDVGETYVLRTTVFGAVDSVISAFKGETCGGGGDYPEAMDRALSAANGLRWRSGNVARVAFVVADAPPHDANLRATLDAALGLRRIGVRLYGLAASGVADRAEYIMRLAALVTGARYTWLTDDSGIGDSHAEPSVVCYQVTRLDNLLIRVLQSELSGRRVEPDEAHIIREVGSQTKGICVVDVDPFPQDGDKDEDYTREGMKEGDSGGDSVRGIADDRTRASISAGNPTRMKSTTWLQIVITASIFLR